MPKQPKARTLRVGDSDRLAATSVILDELRRPRKAARFDAALIRGLREGFGYAGLCAASAKSPERILLELLQVASARPQP